jgi:hypothetical protein
MILQNYRRLPVSNFSVKIVISMEPAKTLSLIFSSTKKQTILKTICVQKVLNVIISLKKKIFVS